MKLRVMIMTVICSLCLIIIAGCNTGENSPPQVAVTAKTESIGIEADEISSYDYTELFDITVNGEAVVVLPSFIDSSRVSAESGGNVYCTYEDVTAFVTVTIIQSSLTVEAVSAEVEILVKEVSSYDYASLFAITENGSDKEVLLSYIDSSAVQAAVGSYTVSCSYGGKNAVVTVKVVDAYTGSVVAVTSVKDSLTITGAELENYDFTVLFEITVDGEKQEVSASYIDSSEVSPETGDYTVTCTFGGKTASVKVTVDNAEYVLTLAADSVSLKVYRVEEYDFLSLFTATKDGAEAEITEDMVTSDIVAQTGEYSYTVNFHGIVKTLTVIVEAGHDIEIIPSYSSYEIAVNELENFDYTVLFSLYVDGVAVRVTEEMIDLSALEGVSEGESGKAALSYEYDGASANAEVVVKVVAESIAVVSAKNIVTYPNGEFIDLTTLFEITKDGQRINVTADMVEGSIDYSQVGVNYITLSYGGETYTATVEVKMGVIIDYANGDTVYIRKGTNQTTYSFAGDFIVRINGIAFTNIESYIDVSEVDFSAAGEYQATITINYNESKLGIGKVNFTTVVKTITYKVVDNNYTAAVKSDVVELPKGTTSYDVTSNLSVTINGKNQGFTDIKSWVTSASCYYEVVSGVDFTKAGEQEVSVAVYVNGVDGEPVIISYYVIIQSDIYITGSDLAVFEGTTVYAKDLFAITEGGVSVPVTSDMITGKIDTFAAGIYTVTLTYSGVQATATVTVYSNGMKGTYHTWQNTIATTDYSYDEDADIVIPGHRLGDLVIAEDGTISIGGTQLTIVSGVDEKTLLVRYGSYDYTLYYDNGIVVLDPDNAIKLSFNDDKRPFVYFNEDLWTIDEYMIVNYGSTHVLEVSKQITYSLDTFHITSTESGESMWYGLYVALAEATSADTVYNVKWGEAVYDDGFVNEVGAISSVTFDGNKFMFAVQSVGVGKVNGVSTELKFAGINFEGFIDGLPSELRVNSSETYEIRINGLSFVTVSSYDLSNMKNGGANYMENSVLLYSYSGDVVYSYKFMLDLENKTFTIAERDNVYGLYQADGIYFYLDGYGTGIASFDSSSYEVIQFTYTVSGSEISIRFQNVKPSFKYGEKAILYIDSLRNTLTVKYFNDSAIAAKSFENSIITDGALVHVGNLVIGATSNSATAKNKLYSAIEIITKDGVIADADKAAYFDTSLVSFTTEGFYRFSITLSVGGADVVNYYTVQIIKSLYADNPVVNVYGGGVINSSNSFAIDEYAQVTLNCAGIIYTGSVVINDDNSFVVKVYSASGAYISGTGYLMENGLIYAKFSGAANFADYYTTGTAKVSGTDNFALREITVGAQVIYIAETSYVAATCERVTVDTLDDGVLKLTYSDETVKYVQLVSWGDTAEGLIILKDYAE